MRNKKDYLPCFINSRSKCFIPMLNTLTSFYTFIIYSLWPALWHNETCLFKILFFICVLRNSCRKYYNKKENIRLTKIPTEKASNISFMKTNTLFITTNVLSSFTWQSNSLNVESKWITASSTLNDLFDRIHKDNIYINLELYLHWGVFMIERRVPNKIVQTWL